MASDNTYPTMFKLHTKDYVRVGNGRPFKFEDKYGPLYIVGYAQDMGPMAVKWGFRIYSDGRVIFTWGSVSTQKKMRHWFLANADIYSGQIKMTEKIRDYIFQLGNEELVRHLTTGIRYV